MKDENRRIHWLRIEQPQVVSQLLKKDGHSISWKMSRTGRVGFRFRDHMGLACMEIYEEFSYAINSSLKKLGVPQLFVEDAREVRLIATLFPGLDPAADEREKLIGDIAEDAADNHRAEAGAAKHLLRFLFWGVNHDSSLMESIKCRYPDWAEDSKEEIKRARR